MESIENKKLLLLKETETIENENALWLKMFIVVVMMLSKRVQYNEKKYVTWQCTMQNCKKTFKRKWNTKQILTHSQREYLIMYFCQHQMVPLSPSIDRIEKLHSSRVKFLSSLLVCIIRCKEKINKRIGLLCNYKTCRNFQYIHSLIVWLIDVWFIVINNNHTKSTWISIFPNWGSVLMKYIFSLFSNKLFFVTRKNAQWLSEYIQIQVLTVIFVNVLYTTPEFNVFYFFFRDSKNVSTRKRLTIIVFIQRNEKIAFLIDASTHKLTFILIINQIRDVNNLSEWMHAH